MEISPESASDERLVVHATAGAAAGGLAAAITTPLDVVKTQLQCQVKLPSQSIIYSSLKMESFFALSICISYIRCLFHEVALSL